MSKKETSILDLEGVSAKVIELADKLDGYTSIVDGVAEIPADAYTELLPEGLDKKAVQAAHSYDRQYTAAAAVVLGRQAVPAFKENKDLASVIIKATADKNKIQHSLDREGKLVSSFAVHGGDGTGELKKVRAVLADQFSAALS